MKVYNVRPYSLEIAATGQVVEPGDAVEVDDKLGKALVAQPDNWSKSKPKGSAKEPQEDDE